VEWINLLLPELITYELPKYSTCSVVNAHCASSIKGLHLYVEENLEKPVKVGTGWTIWVSIPGGVRDFSHLKNA
jgi:hypothetical protein